MGLMQYWERKISKMDVWDMGVLKLALIVFGMVLGAYAASFVKMYVWWFIVVFVVLYIWLAYRIFRR